ncbi:alpha/beta hydrolase [Kutzneria sp. NPDC051319]|uniref:alpha/beta hydrolase family protein n=1 Tax=Kutzneria sp. NPDC051319 TaxID=3155047 RepID=UPI003439113C
MTVQRREFLAMSAAAAAGVGACLLGAPSASAASTTLGAPTQQFPVGVRQYAWNRGSRKVTTYVYYPAATGTPGGAPVTNAPVAKGAFPACEFMHGFSSSPQKSLAVIQPLAAAGFIVPAPYFPNLNINDVYNGTQAKDISELITRTIALNTAANDPLAGHIDTRAGFGVSGHSMGGMTTLSLLTTAADSRITAAIPMSTVDMGAPSSAVHAKVLFMHGDKDTTCPISSARTAYKKLAAPRAFLTFRGASHTSYFGDSHTRTTFVDWMRWSLYADTPARDRLSADATSSKTSWEAVLA